MAVVKTGSLKPAAAIRRVQLWLTLPYVALLFPVLYARNTPALWGFPFFYWYQLLWVLLASGIIALVFKLTKNTQ